MLKRHKKDRKNPSSNPLANLNMKSFYEETKEKEKVKGDSYKEIQKEYERILHKEVQREHRAYKVVFKDHPDLLFIGFGGNRGTVMWQASKYFRDTFNPFFSGQNADKEMLKCNAYRVQELDKFGLAEIVPIPDLLHALKITLPCSVCGKDHFSYSDYTEGKCFIIEGEGNLNQFTKGYILCPDCYKKYLK